MVLGLAHTGIEGGEIEALFSFTISHGGQAARQILNPLPHRWGGAMTVGFERGFKSLYCRLYKWRRTGRKR